MSSRPWQDIAAEAQANRDKTIASIEPPVPEVNDTELPQNVTGIPRQLLTESEIRITETPVEHLLPQLASGKLSSVDVTNAFLRRAGLAQRLANCVTETLPERALRRAEYLDAYLKKNGKPIGPLHGLPISVKELVGMKSLIASSAFVGWYDEAHVVDEDAFMLRILEEAGAVFHVRTTEPQLLMHLETASNLYGVTVNPYNKTLTAGGSSGGEGSLIALGGSVLGIGSDIGGSIRNPAGNNGIWGFKPTSYRLPLGGCRAPMGGNEQIVPTIGPLSTSLEGLKVFVKTLIAAEPWKIEPSLVPLGWREGLLGQSQKNLKVGVMWNDKVVKPHPPVTRALKEVIEKLKGTEGIEVVDWKPHKHDEGWEIISSLYFGDGAQQERAAIESSGEPWLPLSEFIVKEQKRVKEYSITEIWELTMRREQYRAEYAKFWNDTAASDGHAVDVILCPVGPGAAMPLNHSRYWNYTSQWNLLDYPALVFPVTYVDQEKDKAEKTYQPTNAQDEWNHKLYAPEKFADAPICLQLVGRRYEDEKGV